MFPTSIATKLAQDILRSHGANYTAKDIDVVGHQIDETTLGDRVLPSTLRIGDFVVFGHDTYDWGTVTEVTEDEAVVTRPYLHISDFAYSGGLDLGNGIVTGKVIPYMGWETIRLFRNSERTVFCRRRKTEPK